MRGGVWRGAVVGKSGSLLCIVLLMASWEFNKIHIVDFRDTHLTDIWLLKTENLNPSSFDLKSILARQTSEKVAYKP